MTLLGNNEPALHVAGPSAEVPDRAAALASLQAAGCTLVPIGAHAPGDFYVQDPHGIVFDVIARRPPDAAAP